MLECGPIPSVMAAFGILVTPSVEMLKSESSIIPFLVPRRKVWLTPARVPCSNTASIGESKTWTQSEFCTWQNSVRQQEPPKMYIQCISLGDGQTSCNACLVDLR